MMKITDFAVTALILVLTMPITVFSDTKSPEAAEEYRVYFGSVSTSEQEGIFSSLLDIKTGQLAEARLAVEALRPGVITLHPAGTHLYSIGHPAGYTGPRSGSVCAYRIDRASGSLTLLNSQASKGTGPCYLLVDHNGRNILVCHYMSGNCAVLPLAEDGSLKPVSSVQQHAGSSVHPMRQAEPHPHAIALDAAGRYVLVPDLGLDQVRVYRFDPAAGSLTPNDPPFAAIKPGGGPRHFVFHPSGRLAYVNLELTSEVTACRYDAERGTLTEVQTISTLPKDYARMNANAGICITPDGRFLYVSNRGHNSIAQFAVHPDAGTLTSLGYESTRGDVPQTMNIDPSGSCLIVADRRSGHASVFRINAETGFLAYTGSTIEVPNVNSIVFQPLE